MKVGIDTFGCEHGRSGLGSYLTSLVHNLPSGGDMEFELFGPEMDRYIYTGDKDFRFEAVSVPDSLTAERWWHIFKANKFGKKQGYDAMLYAAGPRMIPKKFKVPGVAIVNDIVSNLFEKNDDWFFRQQMKRGLSKVDCIITPSQYVKKDLEKSGIKCRKIVVIHSGIDHSLFYPVQDFPVDAQTVDIKPFAIKRPYIVYASRMENADKKHVELVRAFSLFKEKTGLPHRLVLAGSESRYGEQVHKAVFESSAASDIFITGYFPHESFPELYRGAEACVFPSVTEGAGLSVLEAMATGVPVACSDSGALKEVAGQNACFFNSNDIGDIESAIEKVLLDEGLRKKLIEGGINWTKRFSWEKNAASTVDVFRQLGME